MSVVVKLRAYHPYYLSNFINLAKKELSANSKMLINEVFLPKKIERFTVLRSPHVDKKARDQFERITYQRLIVLKGLNLEMQQLKVLIQFLKAIALGVEVTVQIKNNV